MPIERLPQSTIHIIASSQVLTDSRSVVKELVDNALDAHASAIFIEISLNTIDVIQVRDNGHGIFPDDRGLAGRKHCTSKIRSFDDLETIGGKSLGFRGEALASAAEMSGSMVVSTRIEGEATGVSLTVNRKGEIEKEERTSQAVGTTVRIIDFLKNIPVRRQTAIKASTKHLANIKTLLQAYALARPAVRFGIKILKVKSHKYNWSYAPKKGDGIPDAVIKALGNKVAEHCHWKFWSIPLPESLGFTSLEEKNDAEANESFTIEAFLPVPKCDLKTVNNCGQFVSIDSRPVSSNRGTLKQIINLYKSYLTSGALAENHDTLRDPFICMNITCPSGSYDVNIEPAKDDVLFTNADSVCKAVEDFFRSVYGDLQVRALEPAKSKSTVLKPRGFDVLLARKQSFPPVSIPELSTRTPDASGLKSATQSNGLTFCASKPVRGVSAHFSEAESSKISQEIKSGCASGSDFPLQPQSSTPDLVDGDKEDTDGQPLSRPASSWHSNMYADNTEDLGLPLNLQNGDSHREGSPSSEGEEDISNTKASNPWTFAKINASTHRLMNIQESYVNVERNEQLPTPIRQAGEISGRISRKIDETPPILNKPIPYPPHHQRRETRYVTTTSSRLSPDSSPLRVWRKGDNGGVSRQHGIPTESSNGFGNLDRWVQVPSKRHSITPHSGSQASGNIRNSELMPDRNNLDFVSARNLAIDPPEIAISDAANRRPRKSDLWKPKAGNLNKPFVSPVNNNGFQLQLEGAQSSRDPLASIQTCIDDHEIMFESDVSTSTTPVHPDLARTMDYELRKQEAIQNWKASKRQKLADQQKENTPCKDNAFSKVASPHKNRYNKAIAALHLAEADERNSSTPSLDPSDPRAYLIRAQHREATAAPDESPSRLRKRRKTSRLPLESLREDSIVRDLSLRLSSENVDFQARIAALSADGTCTDRYVATGNLGSGFESPTPTRECIRLWEANLHELVRKLYAKEENQGRRGGVEVEDVHIDLGLVLQRHLAEVAAAARP